MSICYNIWPEFVLQQNHFHFKQISGKLLERKATVEKFKLLIKEESAKFYEEIEVDEENDIEYFKVPPHNGLSEADRMYDFKTVRKSNIILLVDIMFRSFHDQIKILGSS